MRVHFDKFSGLAASDTLFLHGNLASSVWWEPTLEAWQRAGARGPHALYFADWRGSGQNPAAENGFTLDDLCTDMLELCDREGLENPALVGHSLGGLIAARMLMLAPKRFKTAVLLDPVGPKGIVFDPAMYEAFNQMAASPELTRTVILSTLKTRERLTPQFEARLGRDAYKAVRGVGAAVLEILKSLDLTRAARDVAVPVLILHGQSDAIIPLEDSRSWAECLPNAHLDVIADAGHCWNVENAPAFCARLRQWLSH